MSKHDLTVHIDHDQVITMTVTNFPDPVGFQSVRIAVGDFSISFLSRDRNIAADLSNALVGGLLDIREG